MLDFALSTSEFDADGTGRRLGPSPVLAHAQGSAGPSHVHPLGTQIQLVAVSQFRLLPLQKIPREESQVLVYERSFLRLASLDRPSAQNAMTESHSALLDSVHHLLPPRLQRLSAVDRL